VLGSLTCRPEITLIAGHRRAKTIPVALITMLVGPTDLLFDGREFDSSEIAGLIGVCEEGPDV
jgi:hypothetical protein